ncbi:MAG: GMC family oxidoreductase [Cyanobacteria bacterium J06641_5]
MFIDAKEIPNDDTREYDICIVGGGPAGISLAMEFIGKSLRVCILESGGPTINEDEKTDSLRDGENVGLPYFPTRELTDRGLGGNSERWASSICPLEPWDFQKRDWVPYSGWPFGFDELLPYYRKANHLCGSGEYDYEPESEVSKAKGNPDFQLLPLDSGRLKTRIWQYHLPALHWGKAYGDKLKSATNIDTYLYANVVQLEPNQDLKQVTKLKVATISGSQFWVTARAYVLAAGGVEIPRLLLASNQVQQAGLGNEHDLVGRFFMEHPHFNRSATYIVTDTSKNYPGLYSWNSAWVYGVRAGICPSEKLQEEEQLLNYTVRLQGSPFPFPHRQLEPSLDNTVKDIQDWVGDKVLNNRVSRKILKTLKMRPHYPRVLDFLVMTEQAPNPDSRVTLSREQDMLGLNRVCLDWQLTELDRRTAIRMPEIIQEEIRKANLGEVQIHYTEEFEGWPEYDVSTGVTQPMLVGGWHFMGTTRMHDDPKQGVVDANCRVHGLANLYIAGSSVFPTVGYANPTPTIIALALRLAEHLDRQLAEAA